MVSKTAGPRSVTRGQETGPRRDDFGFQGQFYDSQSAGVIDDATKDIPAVVDPKNGVQLALDWLSVSFTPDTGDLGDGEMGEDSVLLPSDQIVDAMRTMLEAQRPAQLEDFEEKNQHTLMTWREQRLRDQVLLAASIALDCSPEDWIPLDYGSHGYQSAIAGPGGARLDFDAKGRWDFNLSLPGKACRRVGGDRMISLLRFCFENAGKARRIDVCIDDYGHTVTPEMVMSAAQGPDVVTKVKQGRIIQGFDIKSDAVTGQTVYFGSPTSRRQMRVYDKNLESDGEIDAVRWEMQERDDAAETLLGDLAYQPWQIIIPRRIVSFIDFRDYESNSEVEHRERLDWFKAFVGSVERANVYIAQGIGTVRDKIDWIRRTIAPMLAVAMDYWKGDTEELWDIVKDGKSRWKPRHRALLAESN